MTIPTFLTIPDDHGQVERGPKKSHLKEAIEALPQWPQIDQVVGETDKQNEPPPGWMNRPIPSELQEFPESVPPELIRILESSIKPDLYRNQDDEKEYVAPKPPPIPLSPIITPQTTFRDTQGSDVASEITRSSSSLSQWSIRNSRDGVSIRSSIGKITVKAPKEVRAISFSMKNKFLVQ